ncbi:MAG: FkbM family methyltransferase [Flammeovirgaceae bacterium]|jgi:FkbM family methyltransferase|nr:FkbM family methyltransferase [Flammeovirgaceae bacterium]
MVVNQIKSILGNLGLQVKRYPDRDLKSRQTALHKFGINKIFDVGANTGQYALEMRNHGFNGQIVSFEPLSTAFKILENCRKGDRNWIAKNIAIGDTDGKITINVSKNSQSSSILEMLPAHLAGAPESIYINQEIVAIRKLDSIFQEYFKSGDNILLKIDTQGYEKMVIDGAEKSLPLIKGLKLEMSLVPLYKDETLLWDMVKFVEGKGFKLYSLENTYSDFLTGQLLQVDGIFYRDN